MVAIFEGVVVGTIGIAVFHFLVAIYARSTRREALEKEFDARDLHDVLPGDREAFVAKGMQAYARSWQRKSLFLIYLIPVAVIALITYVVNNR